MFNYPFRVPARFALIIRAVVSQEGLALKLEPSFKIINVAYPYVARRLLSGETKEMLTILLDVIFDKKGGLRIDRLESLLEVLVKESKGSEDELIPVAGAGLKLLISPNGELLRKNLLMTLIHKIYFQIFRLKIKKTGYRLSLKMTLLLLQRNDSTLMKLVTCK